MAKTSKPRTEFFAITYSYLQYELHKRWYPYEQTIVILLDGVRDNRRIGKVELGEIKDEARARSSLRGALEQIERMERMLKHHWREIKEQLGEADWAEEYKTLDSQSAHIREAAMVILHEAIKREGIR